jgi:Zn-dependent protease with chaperone function
MDFFGQQDRARASTQRLVILFGLALVLTNLAIYCAVAGFLRLVHLFNSISSASTSGQGWLVRAAKHFATNGIWNWELLGWVTLFVTAVIGLVTAYKLRQLSRGGAVVAQLLGGRLISVNTGDPEERRLLNLVEEMAIASSLPVPEVYLLDEECGINAFAAGNEAQDAVIGVTFGALKLLSRDELQGVIAHEFSHIRYGDMRLNTRLIGWLQGVLGLVVLGRILTLSFLQRTDGPPGSERVGPIFHPALIPALALGWICIVAGSFGAFFARLSRARSVGNANISRTLRPCNSRAIPRASRAR